MSKRMRVAEVPVELELLDEGALFIALDDWESELGPGATVDLTQEMDLANDRVYRVMYEVYVDCGDGFDYLDSVRVASWLSGNTTKLAPDTLVLDLAEE
jgi:hypothetical protein